MLARPACQRRTLVLQFSAMTSIIDARCAGCGHVIRVPSALAGKKAKCPNCPGIITIPASWDTTSGVVDDSELTEVANEEVAEEIPDDAPTTEDPPSSPSRRFAAKTGRAPASPGTTRRRGGPAPRGGSQPLIIGIAVVGVVIGLIVLASNKGGDPVKPPPKNPNSGASQTPPPPLDPVAQETEQQVRGRFRNYVEAYNSNDIKRIAEYYPPDKFREVSRCFSEIYEKHWIKIREFVFVSAQPKHDTCTIVVKVTRLHTDVRTNEQFDERADRTINWSKVEGVWLISDKPEK